MKAFAHHQVGLAHTGCQHPYPHLSVLWLWTLFIYYLKRIRTAVMRDDDSRVSHLTSSLGCRTAWRITDVYIELVNG
ncbi:hypothetical protein LMG23994_04252 [Cupriavidus pinatubonensis]|uniref:Uncharacterized protein n=1 Tax=Cupriavidus pinatubonensis TaxID=248026 RepID=A0ABN7Z3K0_9BURK|nr:hypothetical protein LMG23994_04252 [Cupriavidus pinatubonensis]